MVANPSQTQTDLKQTKSNPKQKQTIPNSTHPKHNASNIWPWFMEWLFQILEAWIWRPAAWMPGCWQDWNGLEEVTEVTAFWGEGIGRNSHTLELQELGGFSLV